MGTAHSRALGYPPPINHFPPHVLPARRATSIDFAALIDPTALPSFISPTASLPQPTQTAAPHFLFSWGDSYTSNGFDIDRQLPSQTDPEGLPDDIGTTTTGPGAPNWIEVVTAAGPLNTLNYDFAHGGAAVDNRLTNGANDDVPDFVQQSQTFLQRLASGTTPPEWAPWTSGNSAFVVWFGRNDVYWQVVQNVSSAPRLDRAIESYFQVMEGLFAVGGRRFIVLGIPPMWREPIWTVLLSAYLPAVEPSARYWAAAFTRALDAWREAHPSASVTYYDPEPVFLNFLDHPESVGAPNDYCMNTNNTYPGNGTNCLWADVVHPAGGISAAIGREVAELLSAQNFYASSEIEPGAGSSSVFDPGKVLAGGSSVVSYLKGVMSMTLGVLSSPMGSAWW